MVTKAEEVLQVLAESTQETAKQMASMEPSDPNYEKIVKANGIVSKQYNDLLKTLIKTCKAFLINLMIGLLKMF